MPDPIEVLLVEDNPADARLLVESLKDVGPDDFRVTTVPRLAAAEAELHRSRPDVILLDLSLPDSSGLGTVERIRAAAPGVPVVVLTGLQDEALGLQAVRMGVQDYLVKGMCEGGLAARALRYAVERRRAEAAAQESDARLRAVVETAVDAIITIDERGVMEFVNRGAERMFGYRREEMLGRNVSMLMPEPYRSDHDAYLRRYLHGGRAQVIGTRREVVGLRKDGTTFPVDLSVSEFRVGGRRMFTGIHHDLTNRRRLEREILEASANEQRRVGQELHDGLCQELTAIAFAVEILARKLRDAAPEVVPQVRTLADEVDQAISHTRALARGLNPVEVDPEGLSAALDGLARKVAESFGVSCDFRHEGNGPLTLGDNSTATHLFRIAQEAISNAIRHGGAKTIELKLQTEAGNLSLSVADDGKGFERQDSAAPPRGKPAGIGLQTMSYRAKMINGILDVRPRPRRGVVVTCSVPRGNHSSLG